MFLFIQEGVFIWGVLRLWVLVYWYLHQTVLLDRKSKVLIGFPAFLKPSLKLWATDN